LLSLRIICGIRHRIEGREFIPTGGALVAVNHQSMWETIAFVAILERPVLVFKKELLKVPVYGWWVKKSGSIPVDRDAGVKALNAMTRMARDKIRAGHQVVVFPEGTRARIGERLKLQPGVASIYMAAGAPCTPAVHDSGRVWRQPGGVTAVKSPGLITLRFLPAIEPGLPRKKFMSALEARLHGESPVVGASGGASAEGAAA
jgi:1-acyl-sn-glycerol-3-phosphate acyltransferase